MKDKWSFIKQPANSFAGLPICTQPDELEADIAIIGLHYISPYPQDFPLMDTAPDAIRRQSQVFVDHLDHFDFNFNDTLFADRDVHIVDCGDIDKELPGSEKKAGHITDFIRAILKQNILPIAFGTDEGGVIPVLQAYADTGPLCVVHFDAHIDWIDERDGVREGYSSGMRRASEMPWVKNMAQIGLRGIGSARRREIDDALAFGSVFISAREVHEEGSAACVNRIPVSEHYFITIDCDVLDTAIAPGVLFPSPDGLSFTEITDLVRGIADRGQIAGISLFEVRPELDVNHLSASTAVQLVLNFTGTLAHTGQVGRQTKANDDYKVEGR